MLSVIVPTYNEKLNMKALLTGLRTTLDGAHIPFEILVMDDNSPDHTVDEVARLVKEDPVGLGSGRCRAILRTTNRGLSPAVIDGFHQAKGDVWLVMDADLSHPIEIVPKLYNRVISGEADVAVGSRHCPGGGIEQWPLKRRIISWGAAALARPLTSCSDPMAGFFAVRPSVLEGASLNAAGFKILLEVLVKGHYNKVVEEPITFKDRELGESKLTNGVIVNYIKHLINLYLYPGSAPLLKFLAIGASGACVDLAVFTLLTATVLSTYLGAVMSVVGVQDSDKNRILAAQGVSFFNALNWNYFWNTLLTFPGRRGSFLKFAAVGAVAMTVRSVLFNSGVQQLTTMGLARFPFTQALLVSLIFLVTIINFIGSKFFAFSSPKPSSSSHSSCTCGCAHHDHHH